MLRFMGQVAVPIPRKYDGSGEESHHPRQTQSLSNQIDHVASEQNETGLFDVVFSEGRYFFEEVAETEPESDAHQ